MNNFFIHIYFSWDIYFMASPTTLFCFYFKTAEKMSWKAKNWITQNLTCEYNSGRPNIYLPKTVGLLTYCFLLTYFFLLTFYMKRPYIPLTKESSSTTNEGKRQFNRSIVYFLNIVPIVNDSFWKFKKKKLTPASSTRES